MTLLSVEGLSTEFDTEEDRVRAIDDVSFTVAPGETLGIVGESGCGKSVTALSIMRLLPEPMGKIVAGRVLFDGVNISALPLEQMQHIRGKRIGMVFQEPMTALNPVHTIGRQLTEALLQHNKIDAVTATTEAIAILDKVGIPSPLVRMGEYPHQLSGGMRQRVVIAIALACKPALLIADEPTTALDVTIQAQILKLIKDLQQELGMSVILITHDLGVIAETCDQVAVMYAGKIVERGSVFNIFDEPRHPYTQGLIASIPRLTTTRKSMLKVIEGMVPALSDLPIGCRFQNRCPHATDTCSTTSPSIDIVSPDHEVSCYHWQKIGVPGD
jgi:peptide/nickel transport system ATP-binding protein